MCDLGYKKTSINSECREEEGNWKDVAFMLEAGDKVISFIV